MMDRMLTALADGVRALPPEQRKCFEALNAAMLKTPPPARLSAIERFGWVLSISPVEEAGDMAAALGCAMMVGLIQAGHPSDEAEAAAHAAVVAIGEAAARFAMEQTIAAASTRH